MEILNTTNEYATEAAITFYVHDDDKNDNVDEFLLPLLSSIPGLLVTLFVILKYRKLLDVR